MAEREKPLNHQANVLARRDFPEGLTVLMLREIANSWPTHGDDGQELTVWLQTGRCLVSPACAVVPLRDGNSYDMSLESFAFLEG